MRPSPLSSEDCGSKIAEEGACGRLGDGARGRKSSADHPLFFVQRAPTTDLSFHFSLPTARASRGAAFSLTEVVVALGIFSVSMVGVLALFPVASSPGRENSEETQASILAQTIMDELVDSADRRGLSNAYIVAGPNTIQTGSWRSVNLTTASTNYMAYDIAVRSGDPLQGVGMQGDPIALKATNWIPTVTHWNNGSNVPGNILYLARAEIQPLANLPRLSQATITVETPATVASSNRRSFRFVSLIQGRL